MRRLHALAIAALVWLLLAPTIAAATLGEAVGRAYVPVYMDYYWDRENWWGSVTVAPVRGGAMLLIGLSYGRILAYYGVDGSHWEMNISGNFSAMKSWPRGDTALLLAPSTGEYMIVDSAGSIIATGSVSGKVEYTRWGWIIDGPGGYAIITKRLVGYSIFYNITVIAPDGRATGTTNIPFKKIAVRPCSSEENAIIWDALIADRANGTAEIIVYNGSKQVTSASFNFTGETRLVELSPSCGEAAILVANNGGNRLFVMDDTGLRGTIELPGGDFSNVYTAWVGRDLLLGLKYRNGTVIVALVNMSTASISDSRHFSSDNYEIDMYDFGSLEYQSAYAVVQPLAFPGNTTYTIVAVLDGSLKELSVTEEPRLAYDAMLGKIAVVLRESGSLIWIGPDSVERVGAFVPLSTADVLSWNGRILEVISATLYGATQYAVIVSWLEERPLKIVYEYGDSENHYALAIARGAGRTVEVGNSTTTPCGTVSVTGRANVSLGLVARLEYNKTTGQWRIAERHYGALIMLNITVNSPEDVKTRVYLAPSIPGLTTWLMISPPEASAFDSRARLYIIPTKLEGGKATIAMTVHDTGDKYPLGLAMAYKSLGSLSSPVSIYIETQDNQGCGQTTTPPSQPGQTGTSQQPGGGAGPGQVPGGSTGQPSASGKGGLGGARWAVILGVLIALAAGVALALRRR